MGQCLHNRNIQSLVVEMLEMKHGQSPEIVTDILTQQSGSTISYKIEIIGYQLWT